MGDKPTAAGENEKTNTEAESPGNSYKNSLPIKMVVVTNNKQEDMLLLQVKDEKTRDRKYKPVCPVNLEQQRRMVTEQVYISSHPVTLLVQYIYYHQLTANKWLSHQSQRKQWWKVL